MPIVSVYCTFGTQEEAERIGRMVVKERLAACINILGSCRSIYRWDGQIEETDEIAAILKSTAERADALITRVAELHSYEVPAITVRQVERQLDAYGKWVEAEVGEA